MNPSAPPDVLRETGQVRGHLGPPSAGAVLQEPDRYAQAPHRNPAASCDPDEDALHTFVHGAGI
jgi:hypothetical protein